jgi:hypothetical protein
MVKFRIEIIINGWLHQFAAAPLRKTASKVSGTKVLILRTAFTSEYLCGAKLLVISNSPSVGCHASYFELLNILVIRTFSSCP